MSKGDLKSSKSGMSGISKDKFIIQPNLTTESTLYKIPMILRHGETDTLTLIEYADETNLQTSEIKLPANLQAPRLSLQNLNEYQVLE